MASQSRRLSKIGNIDNSKETWKINVRVLRLYPVPSFINPLEICRVEMVLLDDENNKIQAMFKDKMIKAFRPLLHEGVAYSISNFEVLENNDKLKSCSHKWRILFHKNTSVRELPGLDLPRFSFKFASFKDIQDQKPRQDVFIDIIGKLIGKHPIQTVTENGQREKKKMKIQLQDECGSILQVLLWGDYVDELCSFVDKNPGRYVLIIQFAKVRYYSGQSFVSNSFYATKLLFNCENEAVTDFLSRYADKGLDNETNLLEELPLYEPNSVSAEFTKLEDRRRIVDLLKIKKIGDCVVIATITTIDTQHSWFSSSCKDCSTKPTIEEDGSMHCPKCKKPIRYLITRFKSVFKVKDDSRSASFTLFCREMVQLIGKSASDLRETLIKNNEDGEFPLEFDDILNKKFLFKLSINAYNVANSNYKVYTVARLTEDTELMNAHLALMRGEEASDVITESTDMPSSLMNENDVFSGTGDNTEINSSGICTITPVKTSFEEVVPGELYIQNNEEGQSSAIRPRLAAKAEKDD